MNEFVIMKPYVYITEVSLYKLWQGERSRTEPALRRQVLVRNVLLSCQQYQPTQEEIWLDACFDQLEDDDDTMMDAPPPPPPPPPPPSPCLTTNNSQQQQKDRFVFIHTSTTEKWSL